MTQAPVILLNGLPVKTTYMANCRLCLGTNFGESSTTIVEERFSVMLQVFPFPIPNQIGLPMNVCSKCRKGVELFFKYTKKVQINQKKLEETFIPVDLPINSQSRNIGNAAKGRRSRNPPAANRRQEISNVVEIVSDDEPQNDKDDNVIEVDMQCEPVTDNDENNHDSHVQSSSYEDTLTHFVAVPGPANVYRCAETVDLECTKKRGPVSETSVAEVISLSDEEYEERDQSGDRNDKRKKHAIQNQNQIPKPQSRGRASSRVTTAATMENNVSYVDAPIDNLTGGVVMVYYEADDVEEMEATTSSAVEQCTKPPSSKRNKRSTIKAPTAKQRNSRSSTSEKGHKK
ncbi:uncharacterized protein LOC128303175 [Anopheles moucheti]|uniref:uncharacterized protein LOC128303175 n=1 Tax=Anopheles moucheti TaxID=186751 RepID=UPI0022EFDABD|nr:uncharacterized protein LOC128303175 [Anopheles moucheti]